MQTFLSYPDFVMSAECLNNKRLGKQRVEAKQILLALTTGKGWIHHPATKMWANYEGSLCAYGIAVCTEWRKRGCNDNLLPYFETMYMGYSLADSLASPFWLGDSAFHKSHRRALLRKGWEDLVYSRYGKDSAKLGYPSKKSLWLPIHFDQIGNAHGVQLCDTWYGKQFDEDMAVPSSDGKLPYVWPV